MNWAISELHMKRKEWKTLFNLCLKYKQWELLDDYWQIIGYEEE